MRVAVFGANGRTGRLIVPLLVGAGHEVIAVTRRGGAFPGAVAARADAATGLGVAEAAAGCDAVASALRSSAGNPACSGLARTLLPLGAIRYVSIGGGAMDHPDDRKDLGHRAASWLMAACVERANLADRKVEFDLLLGSRLRWTMLRPAFLLDGAATGRVRWTHGRGIGLTLRRADLAAAVVEALGDERLSGHAPFLSS